MEENVKEYLKKLAKKIAINNIDLHANNYTAWPNGKHTAFASTPKVKINNLVGAGDSWDAANIVGYLANLDAQERLLFANTYVSLYISKNPDTEPPTICDILKVLSINDYNNIKKNN